MTNKKWKCLLPTRYVSRSVFNQILQKASVKYVDNFEDYRYGIVNENKKRIIIRDNKNPDRLVCLLMFEELCYPKKYWTSEGSWKQFIYQIDDENAEPLLSYKEVQKQRTLKENGKSFRKLFHRIYKSSPIFTNSFLFEQMQSLFDTCIKTHINTNGKRRKIKNEEIIDLFLTDKGSITYLNRKDDYEEFDAYNQLMTTLLNNKKSKIEDVIKSILC